jgi:hypothetical protein
LIVRSGVIADARRLVAGRVVWRLFGFAVLSGRLPIITLADDITVSAFALA